MKIKSESTFNLGDTSFRRKTLIDDYKTLLLILNEHLKEFPTWQSNPQSQGMFYNSVMSQTDLFKRNTNEDPSKRGRTLTNSLIKPGLINNKREISEVGLNWINNNSKSFDAFEKILSLNNDNILFMRQLFKLRVYSENKKNYFYPYRIGLKLLSIYKNIPENDLLQILHFINPKMKQKEINLIITNYKKVIDNKQDFNDFIKENFQQINFISQNKLKKAGELFQLNKIDEKLFNEIFFNRKSSNIKKKYFKFYKTIEEFNELIVNRKTSENIASGKNSENNKNNNNPLNNKHVSIDKRIKECLDELISLSKEESIKKAFGFNSVVFKIPKRLKLTDKEFIDTFIEINLNNPLLSKNKLDFFATFISSKKYDIISEYSDMTKRTFNLTGLFNFKNGLVSLVNSTLIKYLINEIKDKFQIAGEENIESYENNINNIFYKDLSLMEILNLTKDDVNNVVNKLYKEFNIQNLDELKQIFENKKEKRFRKIVEEEFNKNKTLELLKLFINRCDENDKKIQEIVTDSATVPTIFEYILAIAWYHISNKDFSLYNSLNLTLDGNLKPLTHAGGGKGDIVIKSKFDTIMLEATLMNKNAQKRGELEPVIRHCANLAIEEESEDNQDVITIFVANQLDNNVINIFRAVSFVELESTHKRGEFIKGVTIFPLKIEELELMIEKKISSLNLISTIKDNYNEDINEVKVGWREKVIKDIFN
ncbi:MAG: AlwI family type II restriction endonuclease [Methanobrevibacter sp.]|jgi:hypothetical protein|nr:AlwI family type II restriction endonuclease [Candidatus Methanoflexus mossambicus]